MSSLTKKNKTFTRYAFKPDNHATDARVHVPRFTHIFVNGKYNDKYAFIITLLGSGLSMLLMSMKNTLCSNWKHKHNLC